MVSAGVKRANRRQVDVHGQTVDLYNYTSDTSERVETWSATSSSPHSIQARIDLRNSPRHAGDEVEMGDVDIDARVYIKDNASGVGSIRDGGGQGASIIDPDQDGVASDGTDYRVLTKFDEDSGLIRLDCTRID